MNQEPNPPARDAAAPPQSAEEILDERKRLRRLQIMMDLIMSVISQDRDLTIEQASQMVADSRTAAMAMFPGKELAYNLIYAPRLQRLLRERYHLN